MKNRLTVIDFFCWAGGFSEWFRQQWFKIVQWIDYWQPAINTHNLNHHLNDSVKSVLDFWSEDSEDVSEIEKLEDTDCIIGSPPCVSFSSSNNSWKADKTLWIKLIEAYLRVIAVKKHKHESKLKVWYMENVPNSQNFVDEKYSFAKLNLSKWAKTVWKKPEDPALFVRNTGEILNSWDYGAPQSRLRFICWEWIETEKFLAPEKTHEGNHVILWQILDKLPRPNISEQEAHGGVFSDPNYVNLSIKGVELTDHFYDTGIHIIEWDEARYLKQNHSYMGKMSFPENRDKPCRTIMATRSAKTREALIYKSEYNRKWNGEYRLPTIREIASLMGFPIVYQFVWSEWSKWRQIWNAVSPHLSSALAKAIRRKLKLEEMRPDFSDFDGLYEKVEVKLNTFRESKFDKPKKRNKDARFRKHPYKSGNITVELMNYVEWKEEYGKEWYIQMYFWTGEWFGQLIIDKMKYQTIEKYMDENIEDFFSFKVDYSKYINTLNVTKDELQKIYEEDMDFENPKNPINILKKIDKLIQKRKEKDIPVSIDIIPKKGIPLWQVYVIYCLGRLIF